MTPRSTTAFQRIPRLVRLAMVALATLAATLAAGGVARAQENPLEPLDTSSPQATYLSFVEQVELLEGLLTTYERHRSHENQEAFRTALGKAEALFDLSDVPDANRRQMVALSFARLADIMNRLPPVDISEIPDIDDVDAAGKARELSFPDTSVPLVVSGGGISEYTLPGTEITITRIEEGPRDGDYVFSAATVADLAEWRDDVDDLAVNDGVVVDDWVQTESEFTGHLLPQSFVEAVPDALDREFLGSPLWKLVVDLAILGLVGVAVAMWYRVVGRRGERETVQGYALALTSPVLLLVLIGAARRFMDEQVNLSGDIATVVSIVVTMVVWAGLAWGFRVLTRLIVQWIIATPAISDESVDAHLLRLLGRVVSVVGAFALAWIGLSRVGVPTVGIGIGAGVAGLAVALAATSTLENLLGGITLYADKPFRVGHTIRVDDDFGTVEAIGPRSTRIRRLDDTRVTLPNADISRTKVINYTERRHILFVHVVGVRYETTAEQLTTIVSEIDSRFRDHPLVLDEEGFPRVRVHGFSESSIDIEVRAHVGTDDFDVFTAVQQDLLLLIHEIVEASGTGFAFPSSTTYLAEDTGLPPRNGATVAGREKVPVTTNAAQRARTPAAHASDDESVDVDIAD